MLSVDFRGRKRPQRIRLPSVQDVDPNLRHHRDAGKHFRDSRHKNVDQVPRQTPPLHARRWLRRAPPRKPRARMVLLFDVVPHRGREPRWHHRQARSRQEELTRPKYQRERPIQAVKVRPRDGAGHKARSDQRVAFLRRRLTRGLFAR